jgi:hypothetical protein
MFRFYILFVSLLCAPLLHAQADSLSLDTLHDAEIKLVGLGENMIHSFDEKERLTSGFYFVKMLSRALKVQGSYDYPFDSLKSVSILKSPDNLFRIFTWNLVLANESFKYFGVIQMNPEMTAKFKDTFNLRPIYPLIDRSDKIRNPLDTTVSNEHWYGCTYYKIVLTKEKKRTWYTLIGWDGNNKMSNKKIVDVLYFEANMPRFGAPVFDLKKKKPYKRLVFEFNNDATMLLRYEEKKKMITYENLAPPRAQDYGHPETYLPDGSYDVLLWKKGVWEKQPGILRDFGF